MKNICYAQSGGPTAVINESARGVIETAKAFPDKFGKVYAGKCGITGVLREELIDTSMESDHTIQALRYTPGAAFGSCRYKLKDFHANRQQYERLVEVFDAHNIGYFFYNGGGDSQDTAHKVSKICMELNYDITCIGIPKTIDNDLAFTDCSPGFGSAAKYLATSIREASIDLASMANSSTKVFILETMGRHTGWLAASTGVAQDQEHQAPHIILLPEVAFEPEKFLVKVKECVTKYGMCTIVVSEGLKDSTGKHISSSDYKDSFGHSQLGGVAMIIAHLIFEKLGYKYHWAVADYLQRSARHLVSLTDLEHAYAVGRAAVEFAAQGKNAIMPTIIRDSTEPYQWHIDSAPLSEIANFEKTLPKEFISDDGFHITNKCRAYLKPLIMGERNPRFINGLPDYAKLKQHMVEKKLVEISI